MNLLNRQTAIMLGQYSDGGLYVTPEQDQWNRMATGMLAGYAVVESLGAAVAPAVKVVKGAAGKVSEGASDFVNWVKGLFSKGTPKTWTSLDKYVGETANAIETKYPGKVIDVNKIRYRPDGTKLTDFDIELDNVVIQVKSGSAKGLTSQITKTTTGTSKEVIGYAPDLNLSSALVKNANNQGIKVFTSLDDLLNYLK